jgi:hypothetical protein
MSILSVLSPIRDYIYAGALVVLLIGFGLFVHHERAIGEAKVISADQKAAAIAEQRDTALTAAAALANNISEGKYEKIIQSPPVRVAAPVGLCHSAPDASMPSTAGSDQGGSNAADNGNEDASIVSTLSDFATNAVKIAVDADAQIAALQAENANLRDEMEKAHGP